jgi:hypothetical protein
VGLPEDILLLSVKPKGDRLLIRDTERVLWLAEIAELMLRGHVTIRENTRIQVLDWGPTGDRLLDATLAGLSGRRRLAFWSWPLRPSGRLANILANAGIRYPRLKEYSSRLVAESAISMRSRDHRLHLTPVDHERRERIIARIGLAASADSGDASRGADLALGVLAYLCGIFVTITPDPRLAGVTTLLKARGDSDEYYAFVRKMFRHGAPLNLDRARPRSDDDSQREPRRDWDGWF